MKNKYNSFEDFLEDYCGRGFGSMTKNDFEVMIFHHLLQSRFIAANNYTISIELQIPETKVKRLRYEADLKYGNHSDGHYQGLFFEAVKKSKFRGKGENVLFTIENISLRKFLDDLLKKDGRFSDSSFNSEIVSIHIDDFAYILGELCSENEKKTLIKEAKKNLKLPENDFIKIVTIIVEMVAGKAIGSVVDLGISGLMDWVKTLRS